MARWLMAFIGVVYFAVFIACLFERRWPWALVAIGCALVLLGNFLEMSKGG